MQQFKIFGISSGALALGIFIFTMGGEHPLIKLVGCLTVVSSFMIGFGICASTIEVRKTYHKPKKLSIMRAQNKTFIVTDGRCFEFDDADWYNTPKEHFKRLMVEKAYNSYGAVYDTRPIIMETKDIKDALSKK